MQISQHEHGAVIALVCSHFKPFDAILRVVFNAFALYEPFA